MNYHNMKLIKSYSDGTNTWLCPVCGRMLLLSFDPYKREVLAKGDEFATHTCCTGGLSFGNVEINENDPYLDIFDDFLNNVH